MHATALLASTVTDLDRLHVVATSPLALVGYVVSAAVFAFLVWLRRNSKLIDLSKGVAKEDLPTVIRWLTFGMPDKVTAAQERIIRLRMKCTFWLPIVVGALVFLAVTIVSAIHVWSLPASEINHRLGRIEANIHEASTRITEEVSASVTAAQEDITSRIDNTATILEDQNSTAELLRQELRQKTLQLLDQGDRLSKLADLIMNPPPLSKRAIELAPLIGDGDSANARARKAIAEERFEDARKLLEEDEERRSQEDAETMGDTYYYEGRIQNAIDWYLRALAKVEDPTLRRAIAVCNIRLGHTSLGLEQLTTLIDSLREHDP